MKWILVSFGGVLALAAGFHALVTIENVKKNTITFFS